MNTNSGNQDTVLAVGQVRGQTIQVMQMTTIHAEDIYWRVIENDQIGQISDKRFMTIQDALENVFEVLGIPGEAVIAQEPSTDALEDLNVLLVASPLGRPIENMADAVQVHNMLASLRPDADQEQSQVTQAMDEIVKIVTAFKGPFSDLTASAQAIRLLLDAQHNALMKVTDRDIAILASFIEAHRA